MSTATPSAVFPRGLLWGAAGSALQVEGGLVNADWWAYEHASGTPIRQPSMDGIDQYSRYPSDMRCLARLGLNAHRLSIEWSTVEPAPGCFSAARLTHYRAVLLACQQLGLTPVVALHHYTTPTWLSSIGGWQHPDAPRLLARFIAAVMKSLGDLIPLALTLTALNLPALRRAGRTAPSFFQAGHGPAQAGLVLAQARAQEAVGVVSPCTRVGGSLVLCCDRDEDLQSWTPWLPALRDWHLVEIRLHGRRGWASTTALSQDVTTALMRAAAVLPPHLDVLVVAGAGIWSADDARAQQRWQAALIGIHAALTQGVRVRGVLYNAAFDQYEWADGYDRRRGLVAVDRTTQRRSVRPLGRWFGQVAREGAVAHPVSHTPLHGQP